MSGLRDYGAAPDFTGTQRWFNSPPLSLSDLRGRVVLVDFWTYTCINCLRTLPYLEAWDKRYRAAGLTIVGVHSPEFPFEKDASNVASAIRREGIRYPVVQDNDLTTWRAWGNEYWPSEYLIDQRGHVREASFGEGDYTKTEHAIRSLLAARGAMARPAGVLHPPDQATPETYVGTMRAQGYPQSGAPRNGTHAYPTAPAHLAANAFWLSGDWTVGPEDAAAGAGARIDAEVVARHVYLVASSLDRARTIRVTLDGRPQRAVRVVGQRLYEVADPPDLRPHRLSLRLDPGLSAYSFTFG
jgi:thiol-disulfide isomerase/thioredoxin